MPSQHYFAELTKAVWTDVNQVKGFPNDRVPTNSNNC